MKRYILIKLLLLSVTTVFSQNNDNSLKQLKIESEILNETRSFFISLPEYYDSVNIKYPTLYLLDGLDNYSSLAASINILVNEEIIPKMIIVCVESSNRIKDMTPTHSTLGYYGDYNEYNKESGKANLFIKFLNNELISFVDSAYRTNNYRILSGHSFSGLATVATLLDSQSFFNAYIAVDPSVWWDNGYIVNQIKQYFETNSMHEGTKMYLGATISGPIQQEPLETIIDIFKSTPKLDFQSKIYEDESHMTVPYICNYEALKFIFTDWVISYQSIIQGKDEVEKFIKKVKNTYDLEIEFDENLLITESIKYLSVEQHEKAIKILDVNLQLFPKSVISNLLIAENYRFMKEYDNASIFYQKVLKLDPTNQKALEMINLTGKSK